METELVESLTQDSHFGKPGNGEDCTPFSRVNLIPATRAGGGNPLHCGHCLPSASAAMSDNKLPPPPPRFFRIIGLARFYLHLLESKRLTRNLFCGKHLFHDCHFLELRTALETSSDSNCQRATYPALGRLRTRLPTPAGRGPVTTVAQGGCLSRLRRYRSGNCTFVTSGQQGNRRVRIRPVELFSLRGRE